MRTSFSGQVRRSALCGTILASALMAMPALAQQTPPDDTAPAAGDAPNGGGDEIVVSGLRAVTATKTDTPLKEIPQAISVVTADQIIDQGALTLQESQRYTAGVTNGGTDTRGDFSYIRGFQSVTFLDGLKRNFGFVYIPQSEVYTLDRVETLLGPSAVLYGAGSAGGLINMVSKRPSFTFAGEMTGSYGTYDRKQFQIDLTGPLSQTVAVRVTGVVRDGDTLVRKFPDNRVVFQPSITWQPSDKTNVTLIGLYQRDYVAPSNFLPLAATLYANDDTPRISSRTNLGEPSLDKGTKHTKAATLLIDHSFSDALSFHSATRFQRDRTYYGQAYYNAYSSTPFLDPNSAAPYPYTAATPYTDVNGNLVGIVPRAFFGAKASYRTLTTDNHFEAQVDTWDFHHTIVAGVDYQWFRGSLSQAYEQTTPIDIYNPVYGTAPEPTFFPATKQVLKQLGFYASDQIKFRELGSLVLGVRHDNLKTSDTANAGNPKSNTNNMTYRAGLSVNVTKTISPYAQYSESFQPISGLNQFGQSFVPLYGKAYEFGVKWQPWRTTLARATYFHIEENNHIIPDPANPLVSIQGGKERSKGYEFQVDHRMRSDITLTASYTHIRAQNSNESYLVDLQPKDTASGFATKTFMIDEDTSIHIGGGVRYVGKQTAGGSGGVVTPSFTLVDAIGEFNWKHWTLQVNATNLFNKFYYAACSQYAYCVPGDARQVYGTIRYRF